MEAEIAKQVSYRFECKKDALRQNQDGSAKVTFNIHPEEMPSELFRDQMGQRYLCVLVPLNDDETPREKPKSYATQAKMMSKDTDFQAYVSTPPATQDAAERWIEAYCKVTSCAQITEGSHAGNLFKDMRQGFNNWLNAKRQEEYYDIRNISR